MHHCAFEHDSFDDLMTSFDRLRKAGINTISIMRAEVRIASDSDRTAASRQARSVSHFRPVFPREI
jgi:hypothetical protein